MNYTLAFFANLGMPELMVLAFLGLLIFGKKLPEVGKSLGQGIVSFKKGLQGVESHMERAMNEPEPVKKKKKKKKAIIDENVAVVAEPTPAHDEPVATEEPRV